MTTPLTLLIAENETPSAEIHAEYIRHIPGFSQILLTGSLAQTRTMIECFKPGLILLDNYLSDGRGANLLRELVQAHYPSDVVFTATADDMKMVSEAVRCDVFDYLIKSIAYERLGQTLTRPRQHKHMLESIDSISQKQIGEMFNAYARGEPKDELPTGIDPLTLNVVRKLLKEPGVQHMTETAVQALTASRTIARRYLEYCAGRHLIIAEIVRGKVGRPQRTYHSG